MHKESKGTTYTIYVSLFLSLGLYIWVNYFGVREDSISLLSAYAALFVAYIFIIKSGTGIDLRYFIAAALLFRFTLLFSIPNLSDDIYRFVWDGRLLHQGLNPFQELPAYYMSPTAESIPGIDAALYGKLNSKEYFTIYPPFAQAVFWFSVWLSPQSVLGSAIVMKSLIFIAEVGTLWFLFKLLRIYGLPRRNLLLYALNPLVIIELTGNLHYEAFMIFFLLTAIYWVKKGHYIKACLPYALAICSKLIPLMFLPFFLKRLRWKKTILFYTLSGLVSIGAFVPLLSKSLITGMGSSIALYFHKFEFNASVYYLIRAIGFQLYGYNIIQTAGKYLALGVFVFVLIWAAIDFFREQSLFQAILWTLVAYLLMATTVHPWYITTLLAVSLLTEYRFPILWTLMIFLTYVGYTSTGFQEHLGFTFMEYATVLLFMIYEVYSHRSKKENKDETKDNTIITGNSALLPD